ncbi:glutamine amidotransferase [Levilactobacillus tujiorum]|uniref:glutamine amidotransferase n=1 Tax=Levilactobacillus tujiorum TaxID=2912243 RepID=UPI001456DA08|nr:glutamine amidotransferase [Levilactobacillus tujiorum]NLR31718.1 cytoplasmic protein [Levilactobacillus tujiorum]
MAKVLLAGESWIVSTTEYKGYDSFTSSKLEIGCTELLDSLKKLGHDVHHIRAHDVPEYFPWSRQDLDQYDVVILSDIGSNSFNLSNDVFANGNPSINRLALLKDWVADGGALFMAGGYLSFAGYEGKAHYHNSPIEDILPVNILPYDDRVEAPQGLHPTITDTNAITDDLGDFPVILGYQKLQAKEDAQTLITVDHSPLLVTGTYGKGRSLAYATDIAPHWASQQFMDWKNYGEFFSRCINWLANENH